MRKKVLTTIMILAALSLSACGSKGSSVEASKTSEINDSSVSVSISEPVSLDEPEVGGSVSLGEEIDKSWLDKLLDGTRKIGDYECSIATGTEYDVMERGYRIDTTNSPDAPYCYFICSGERSTGGYKIEVADLFCEDGVLTIVVKETAPSPRSMVTQALTYPQCCVNVKRVNGSGYNVVVKTTEGEILENIDKYE